MNRLRLLIAGLLVVSSLAACGSSSGSGPSTAPTATSTANGVGSAGTFAGTAPPASDNGGSSSSSFCAQLQPNGEGPAEAFSVIPLYSAGQGAKAARSQLTLMGTITPPAQIASAWTAWKSYLSAVVRTIAKNPGGLSKAGDKVEKQRKTLENYAFAHCK